MTWLQFGGPLTRPALNHCTKNFVAIGAVAWAVSAGGLIAPGCSESKPAIDVADTEGERMCCVLASACDDAEGSEGGEAGAGGASEQPTTPEQCHELGHEADPDACRAAYHHCLELCGVSDRQESEAEQACE